MLNHNYNYSLGYPKIHQEQLDLFELQKPFAYENCLMHLMLALNLVFIFKRMKQFRYSLYAIDSTNILINYSSDLIYLKCPMFISSLLFIHSSHLSFIECWIWNVESPCSDFWVNCCLEFQKSDDGNQQSSILYVMDYFYEWTSFFFSHL